MRGRAHHPDSPTALALVKEQTAFFTKQEPPNEPEAGTDDLHIVRFVRKSHSMVELTPALPVGSEKPESEQIPFERVNNTKQQMEIT